MPATIVCGIFVKKSDATIHPRLVLWLVLVVCRALCHPHFGVGLSQISGLGDSRYQTLVSHEIGHNFGLQHLSEFQIMHPSVSGSTTFHGISERALLTSIDTRVQDGCIGVRSNAQRDRLSMASCGILGLFLNSMNVYRVFFVVPTCETCVVCGRNYVIR